MSYSDISSGGMPNPGLIYSRISDNLRKVQSDCALMAHFYNTEEGPHSANLAKGWLTMSEFFKQIQHKIMMMEVGRAQ